MLLIRCDGLTLGLLLIRRETVADGPGLGGANESRVSRMTKIDRIFLGVRGAVA